MDYTLTTDVPGLKETSRHCAIVCTVSHIYSDYLCGVFKRFARQSYKMMQ